MIKENIIGQINKLARKNYDLKTRSKRINAEISEILEGINPQLEDLMRKGYSFLDEMVDYAEKFYSEKEISQQIEEALVKLEEKESRKK